MERLAEILEKAIALQAESRTQFLNESCAGDEGLRREVESLLQAHEQAGSRFLNGTSALQAFVATATASQTRIGRRIGAYLLEEPIGRGGMGEVFAAVRADGQYRKRVALKLVRGGYDSAFILERFRNERQILAGLDHPNIARLLDGATTDEGAPYLVMELVEGTPIDAFCNARGFCVTERLQLFRHVCSAVQYAHQRLVIHRDIKPGNILVTQEGVPKLLDFGIAKILDASGTTDATVLRPMTPEYASPEQVRGEAVTTATDVYSLGVVLYRLLTGRLPYSADTGNTAKLAQAIGDQEAERPSSSVQHRAGAAGAGDTGVQAVSSAREDSPARLRRRLRGDLDFIVLKALRKEPEARYASVEQFSEDIRRHLEGLPIAARRGTWTYRSGRFVRRHRVGVAAAAGLLLTLMAAVVVTLREARIAEANERRAEARFNDVRKLANSLLFEINDSVKDVPGATQARHLILQRSLQYLDSLAKESGDDPALLRELATAYSRVGAIQGNPQYSNLGDTGAGLASMQKSIRMREALARRDPDNRQDRVQLATAYVDFAELQMSAAGNVSSGFDYGRRALAILDRELAASPDDPALLAESAYAYEILGIIQVGEGLMGSAGTVNGGLANLQTALSINQRRFRFTPGDVDARKREAIISTVLGDALVKLGERPRALELYRKSLGTLNAIDPDGTNLEIGVTSAILASKIGDALLVEGSSSEAMSYHAKAELDARRLSDADPHDEKLLIVSATASAKLGLALVESGRIDEGLRFLRKALTLAEADSSQIPLIGTTRGIIHLSIGIGLERAGQVREASREYAAAKKLQAAVLAGGAKDPRMKIYFAYATDRLAGALFRLGELGSASHEYDESLALLEPLRAADPDNQEALYAIAETYAGMGTLAAGSAGRASLRQERLAQLQAARDWFRKSLDAWNRISHPARISFTGFEVTPPEEVSRRLAHCLRDADLYRAPRRTAGRADASRRLSASS